MKFQHYLLTLSILLPAIASAAPPTAGSDNRSVPKNTPITMDVLDNDFDPDGDTINLLPDSITQPENGSVSINNDGGIQYTPNLNFVGIDTFSYVIVDSSEGQEQAEGIVTINVVDTTISVSANTPNERNIASVLNSICSFLGETDTTNLTGGYKDLANNCETLLTLFAQNPEAAKQAIQQISPEETLTLVTLGDNASSFQSNIVSNRMVQLAQNSASMPSNGLSWSGSLPGGSAGENSLWSKVGIFTSVKLEKAEKDRSGYEAGFDSRSHGITVGADYALSTDWYSGVALGWTKDNLDYRANGGSVDSDIYTLLAFSTYHINNFSVDVQAGLGQSTLDVYRNINYGWSTSQFSASTEGKTNGSQWFLKTQAQYMWNHNAFTLYPSFQYQISNSQVSSYTDNNAGGWEVMIGEQNLKQQRLEAGLQGTYALNQSWGVLIPSFDLNVIADLDSDQGAVYGQFAYAPASSAKFYMYGEPPESVFYLAGLGLSAILPNGGSAFLNFNKTLSYSDYSSLQFQFGFRLEY